jgi:hypothetical protein
MSEVYFLSGRGSGSRTSTLWDLQVFFKIIEDFDAKFEWSHLSLHHVEPCVKEKIENLRFYNKTNIFFGVLPFSRWAILATWLHLEIPHKIK